MKIKFILAATLLVSLRLFALSFYCTRLDSGESASVQFNSDTPTLSETGLMLITPQGACDQSFNFNSDCVVNLVHQADDYSYGFRCDSVFGDVYFTPHNGGAAQFRCFGDKVPTSYNNRIYRQCVVSR